MPDADQLGTQPEPDESVPVEVDSEDGDGAAEGTGTGEPSRPIDADEVLLAAVDIARAALLDITPAHTIGEPAGHIVEGEHVLSLLFECTMAGYPGWRWTVSMSRIDENSEPFVLETELMPGEHALLAPEWVPWSDRLAEYRSAQELAAADALADADNDEIDDEDDEGVDEDDIDDDEDVDDDELLDDEDELLDDDDELLDGDGFRGRAADIDDNLTELIDDDIEEFDGEDEADDLSVDEMLAAPEGDPDQASDAEDDSQDGAPEPPAAAGSEQVAGHGDEDDKRS
jgi:hypothetical protein